MEIKFRKYKNIFVLDLIGEFDLYNTTLLLVSIKKLRKKKIKYFIINMANVSYIDSSGIGALIKIQSECQLKNGKVFLSGTTENIVSVFKLAGLDSFFNLEKGVKPAIKKCITINEVIQE